MRSVASSWFVGLKMTVAQWIHINTYLSLSAITAMLTTATLLSIRHSRIAEQNATQVESERLERPPSEVPTP
jgi:predicted tellurium resistance membrane protein TerC